MSASAQIPESPANIPQGLLSSPQLKQCFQEGLLIKNYLDSCLRPATYEMRLGEIAFFYENGIRTEIYLGNEVDRDFSIQKSLLLKPNSLTFITTIESFCLPRDIIARFNLRTRWVRKGMLLGTAPIVEPEFQGKLIMPVHNFSSQPIQIHFAERIIAVEFTKTLPANANFVPNDSAMGDIRKYMDEIGAVESSVSAAISKNEKLYGEIQSKTKLFSIAGAITLFLLICANLTLLINIFNSASNASKEAVAAQKIVRDFAGSNEARFVEFRDEIKKLKEQVERLKKAGEQD